jgi:hypothetical protein
MGLFKNDIGRKIVAIKGKFFMRLTQNFFEQQKDSNGNAEKCAVSWGFGSPSIKDSLSWKPEPKFYPKQKYNFITNSDTFFDDPTALYKAHITDIKDYNNSKIKNLFHMPFNHLISLTTENNLVRSLQKYLININSVMYINAHMINNNIFYEGCLIGSDGTSSGFFLIEQDCVRNLFKFNAEFDNYIRNKLYQEKKFQIFPGRNDYNFNENIITKVYGNQVVIIGAPKMNRLMEISAQDMYDSISELNKYSNQNKEKRIEGFLEFDTKLTKIEFSMINGSFSRKSDKLEKIPYIKTSFLFDMDDYIKLIQIDNKINKI